MRWGGYYISREGDIYRVFRLLDFTKDVYHIQLFQEKFDHPPTLEEIKALTPNIWHAPISVEELLYSQDLALIGHEPLTEDDLSGYSIYLKAMGASAEEVEELVDKLIAMSVKSLVKIKLIRDGNDVKVEVQA